MNVHENILLVANYDSDVGYAWWLMENFWAEIAKHFGRQGRRCVLIYPKLNGLPEIIASTDIEVVEHDFNDRSASGLARLAAIIRRHRIRSVYLTDREYYAPMYAFLRLVGVRVIVQHDHKPGERPPARFPKKFLKKLIYAARILSCDHYIAVSDFVRKRMISSAAIPAERCTTVLNGIRRPGEQARRSGTIRKSFGIPDEAIVVISTGRAVYYKGIDFIIECAAHLVCGMKRTELYFIHCGDGPDLEAFKSQVASAGLAGHFIFAGRRNDVRDFLLDADIGIQASKGEAFSLSILEYMDAGLATIVPDVCGNGEAVRHEETGILYAPGDRDTVSGWILKLASDSSLRHKLGDAAARTVKEQFDIRRTNRQLLELLDRVF